MLLLIYVDFKNFTLFFGWIRNKLFRILFSVFLHYDFPDLYFLYTVLTDENMVMNKTHCLALNTYDLVTHSLEFVMCK
jgi:hypothetical protein